MNTPFGQRSSEYRSSFENLLRFVAGVSRGATVTRPVEGPVDGKSCGKLHIAGAVAGLVRGAPKSGHIEKVLTLALLFEGPREPRAHQDREKPSGKGRTGGGRGRVNPLPIGNRFRGSERFGGLVAGWCIYTPRGQRPRQIDRWVRGCGAPLERGSRVWRGAANGTGEEETTLSGSSTVRGVDPEQ